MPASGRPLTATKYAEEPALTGDPGAPGGQTLTAREAEVLTLIAQGQSNQGIADSLGITVNTVERHIANLYPQAPDTQPRAGDGLRPAAWCRLPTNGFH